MMNLLETIKHNLNQLNKGLETDLSDDKLDKLISEYQKVDPNFNPLDYIDFSRYGKNKLNRVNKLDVTDETLCVECECPMTLLGCSNPGCRHKYIEIISKLMLMLGISSDEIKLLETNIDIKTIKELRDKYPDVDFKKLFTDNELELLGVPSRDTEYYNFILPTYKLLESQL
jgi:hypothetical protein